MTTPRLLSNRYELGETLGYGGMSEVHKGRDVRLGRDIAVKVLRADLARDPQFQERFRREAQNAAALNHPAIVAVYDTGETRTEYGPLPYIVMEYVDGKTLRDIVKSEGPLPGQRAMEIMADVCAALDFSHRHGIIHRDVKPANVMITKTGAVKVMDFGIARAMHDGQAAVTQTAAVIGTAQYLSPEQARGETVDARSDVYATGCVLFELLTGEPPFTGDSPVAVAYQHVREDPRKPSQVNPRVSLQLDAIVLKAMAKGAANRYQSAAEMRMDIVRVLSGQRPAAPMVMTDEDRTSVMGGGRVNDVPPRGRHRPDALVDDYDDYDKGEEERRRKRRKAWTTTLVTLLVVAMIVLGIWLVTKVFTPKNSADNVGTLPNLIGQTENSARQALLGAGFQRFDFGNIVCEPGPGGQPAPCGPENVGNVVSQDPPAGKVDKLNSITLKVGRSASQVKVPDVKGKSKEEAGGILTQAGFTIAPEDGQEDVTDQKLVGKVSNTAPGAGVEVAKGTTVKLLIGKAQPQVPVTNVTGQDFGSAKANLESDGWVVAPKVEVDSDQTKDLVVDQNPKKAKPGSVITLKVSKGPQDQIQMPNLVGQKQEQALQTLRGMGWNGQLAVNEVQIEDPNSINEVVEQNPAVGQRIDKNQTVNVNIARKPKFGGTP